MQHNNIIRNTLFLLFLFLAGIAMAQPIDKEMYIKVVGMNMKKNCPFEEDGLVVNALSYKSGYLHFAIEMEDDYMFGRDTAALKKFFADRLRYQLEPKEFQYLYEKLGDIHGGFIYDITLDSSRRSFSLKYTPEETRKIWADRKRPEYQLSDQWRARYFIFVQTYWENKYNFSDRVSDEEPINIDSSRIVGETLTYFISTSDQIYSTYYEKRDSWRAFFRNMLFFDDPDLLRNLAIADYNLLAIYENVSRTDSFHIFFPHNTLAVMNHQQDHFTEANDEQLEAYMRNAVDFASEEWKKMVQEHPELYSSMDIDYHDGYFQLALNVKEGAMNFNMTPSELQTMKSSLCTTMKEAIESSLETPDIIHDTLVVTLENFYHHLKGYRVIYMEDNTRKAMDIEISTDEIRNAKLPVSAADETTLDKIQEQILADRFAQDLAYYSKEMCPMWSGEVLIDSLIYDYKDLHFYCRIDSVREILGDSTEVKNSLRAQFSFAKSESAMFSTIVKLHGGLNVHYFIPDLDSTVTIRFSNDELVELIESDTLSELNRARTALNSIIETTNPQLPAMIDYLTRLDSLYIEGSNLVYHYTILNNFELLKENSATMEWSIKSQFASPNAEIQYLLLLCIRSGYGICYRYEALVQVQKGKKKAKKSKGKEIMDFCFSAEELKEYIQE